MAGFRFEGFRGIRPKISERLLRQGEGTVAENCKLGSGDLIPWRTTSLEEQICIALEAGQKVDTIYRYPNNGNPIWFQWTTDVDMVRGPVVGDTLDRQYYTGDGVPKMTFQGIADVGFQAPGWYAQPSNIYTDNFETQQSAWTITPVGNNWQITSDINAINASIRSPSGPIQGNAYLEMRVDTLPADKLKACIGFQRFTATFGVPMSSGAQRANVSYHANGSIYGSFGASAETGLDLWEVGDRIGIAIDVDTSRVWFARNGVWQGSGTQNPSTVEGGYVLDPSFRPDGDPRPLLTIGDIQPFACTIYFDSDDWAYAAPSGFTFEYIAPGAVCSSMSLPIYDTYSAEYQVINQQYRGQSWVSYGTTSPIIMRSNESWKTDSLLTQDNVKIYFETTHIYNNSPDESYVGIVNEDIAPPNTGDFSTNGIYFRCGNQQVRRYNSAPLVYTGTYPAASSPENVLNSLCNGDTLMVALDIPNKKVFFGINGTWFDGSDPNTNTGGEPLEDDTTYSVGVQPAGSVDRILTNSGGLGTRFPTPTGFNDTCEVIQSGCISPGDFRILGVPAPANAPTVLAPGSPDNTLEASAITVRNFVVDRRGVKGDGTGANPTTEWQVRTQDKYNLPDWTWAFNMTLGQEFIVRVLDANTLELIAQNGATTSGESSYGAWFRRLEDATPNEWRESEFKFYLPNTIRVTATGHGLSTNDVVRLTEVTETPKLTLADLTDSVFQEPGTGSGHAPFTEDGQSWWGAQGEIYGWDVNLTTYQAIDAGKFRFQLATIEDTLEDTEFRSYAYTWVTDLGEEGPPSPASEPAEGLVSGTWALSNFDQNYPIVNYGIVALRIYRTSSGTNSTAFQFVDEIGIEIQSYNDIVEALALGEALQTTDWDPPPSDMQGLVGMANGALAGFEGKNVYLSEPYQPHAWPYVIPLDYDIVGLGVYGQSLVITTKGFPYVASGAHPRAMTPRRIEVYQSCIAKQSIANVGDVVVYASPDGLIVAGSGGFRVVTDRVYGKDEWQALGPATMHAAVYDNKYFGFHSAGTIIYDPIRDEVGLTTTDDIVDAAFSDIETDSLYITDSIDIDEWEGGLTNRTLTWKSAKMRSKYPMNPGVARVEADTYPVTFRLYADDVLKHTESVSDDEAFRLPSGYLAEDFHVEIESSERVRFVQIGETMADVADG